MKVSQKKALVLTIEEDEIEYLKTILTSYKNFDTAVANEEYLEIEFAETLRNNIDHYNNFQGGYSE